MILRSTLAAAAVVAAMNLTGTAFAGADDYVFEPVQSEIKSSNVATVAVRLLHKPTGKPVIDAAIVQTRLDMAPDGMAPLTMAGRWLLTVSAKVQGEPDTVVGKLIFKVIR
jgi:hypothetical protein